MSSRDLITEAFRKKGRTIGSVFLLKPFDAIALIDRAEASSLDILGLEGFRLIGEDLIQPIQEHSVDYEGQRGNHERARSFLRDRLDQRSLWFDVVVE